MRGFRGDLRCGRLRDARLFHKRCLLWCNLMQTLRNSFRRLYAEAGRKPADGSFQSSERLNCPVVAVFEAKAAPETVMVANPYTTSRNNSLPNDRLLPEVPRG